MDEFERNRLSRAENATIEMAKALKVEQQRHATAMQVVAAANRALEEIVGDLEGRARAVRALLKQISKMPKPKTAKRR